MVNTITTWLELLGLLLLAAAAGVEVGQFTLAGGLGTSGAVLISGSAAVAWRSRPPKAAIEGESTA